VRRVAVIGAGPIGIAAALSALDRGFDVTVFEKGSVGDSLRAWGDTRFFSPVSMNLSPCMRAVLGNDVPPDDALLKARDMIDCVLAPIADRDPLRGRIRTNTPVVAIGRRGLTRSDYAGHPLRAERPFRLVLGGGESCEADVVLDATGGYVVPNPIGAGGLPLPNETALDAIRTLGALSARADELHGKRVLLVGDGHSAANAITMLRDIGPEHVTWAVRKANRRPCEEVANDPLPERQRVVATANDLAESPPPWLTVERRALVEAVRDGEVVLSGDRTINVDRIIAFTGFHPDGSMHRELTVETSPVTEGSARLYRAICNVTDCLSVPRVSPEDLASGEPDFFFIGSRAYGRAPSFLLQTGLAQVETILDSLRR
jgi:thioredoxin reductase